jgi:cell division protein FtsQ
VRLRVVVALAVGVLVLIGGWLWLRDSSLVGVKRVTVVGATGRDASRIRSALTSAGRKMTTLDVQTSTLRRAVARYTVVKDLRVSTQFPHGLRIEVVEQIPVAAITADGRRVAVAGDGSLLRDVRPSSSLPQLSVPTIPGGPRLTDRRLLAAIAVLAAAPYQLLAHVGAVTRDPAHGLVVDLRHGPTVYFGDTALLGSKWTAAADVLADPGSAGASYIDVVDPARPAAGSSSGTSSGSGASAGSGASTSPTGATGASPTAATGASPTAAAGTSPTATGASPTGAGSSPTAGGATSSPGG